MKSRFREFISEGMLESNSMLFLMGATIEGDEAALVGHSTGFGRASLKAIVTKMLLDYPMFVRRIRYITMRGGFDSELNARDSQLFHTVCGGFSERKASVS